MNVSLISTLLRHEASFRQVKRHTFRDETQAIPCSLAGAVVGVRRGVWAPEPSQKPQIPKVLPFLIQMPRNSHHHTPKWFSRQSLYESSGSLFKVDSANCHKPHTYIECVHASVCRALQRNKIPRLEPWLPLTTYNCTRSSYIYLSLNSNNTLKMKPLYSPLIVNPTITLQFLGKEEPEKLENLKQRTEGKEPASGPSTLFNIKLT